MPTERFEGLELLAGLAKPGEDNSALLLLCASTEPSSRVGSAKATSSTNADGSAVTNSVGDSDTKMATNFVPCVNEVLHEKQMAANESQQVPFPVRAPQQPPPHQSQLISKSRPNTAERIRLRTAKLMGELSEIDKFRELRISSNGTSRSNGRYIGTGGTLATAQRGNSSQNGVRGSPHSPSRKEGVSLPPIAAPRTGGLFSETLATSKHSGLLLAAQGSASVATEGGSRLNTANTAPTAPSSPQMIKHQTRGNGMAGFHCRESKISGLVSELTNKWGR